MRNQCCDVDPLATDCTDADCSVSRTGSCVPMLDCGTDYDSENYFFDEFTRRCERKMSCPKF